jgi:hypothetical protein
MISSPSTAFPSTDEFPPFYQGYIARVERPDVVPALRQQGRETLEWLGALPPEAIDYSYAPGKWTVREIVGHIIDTERVMIYRALCFARGEEAHLPGMDQEAFVQNARYAHRSWESFLEEYQAVRQATYQFFKHLHPDDWLCTGLASIGEFTVRALAFIVAGHELHHLKILNERYLSKKF